MKNCNKKEEGSKVGQISYKGGLQNLRANLQFFLEFRGQFVISKKLE